MDEQRIRELRGLCEAATGGPWEAGRAARIYHREQCRLGQPDSEMLCSNIYGPNMEDITVPCAGLDKHDAAFIAAARTALPELLDEVGRLHKKYGDNCDECDGGYGADMGDAQTRCAEAERDAARATATRLMERLEAVREYVEECEQSGQHPAWVTLLELVSG